MDDFTIIWEKPEWPLGLRYGYVGEVRAFGLQIYDSGKRMLLSYLPNADGNVTREFFTGATADAQVARRARELVEDFVKAMGVKFTRHIPRSVNTDERARRQR
ncbi:hypothetical protein [Sphaerimonospora thailandensis]|uniref:Uncharacterized protein n=1 Tax=Sphaerimonospora thailandensis TaxID=795644 RepID=A0A8J3W1I2_9ACTN|nr:hypothetical protein [Sphaerimonospora thailandensis]GIH72138.1 hypothetical protein Mth01_43910 [Sphaerimonospora thailandensis]